MYNRTVVEDRASRNGLLCSDKTRVSCQAHAHIPKCFTCRLVSSPHPPKAHCAQLSSLPFSELNDFLSPLLSECRTLKKWMKDMNRLHAPADDIALAVLSHQFQCCICVLQDGKVWQSQPGREQSIMRKALFVFIQTPMKFELCIPQQEGGWVWNFASNPPSAADVFVVDHKNFP